MATVGNNESREASHVRDAFFDSAEKDYFIKLMNKPKERDKHYQLLAENAEKLFQKAQALIEKVENGEFTNKEMYKVEKTIAHCLAAVEDLHLELQLELTP